MITIYAVEGDDLIARHYCDMGNQPTLRLNREKSAANDLRFDFGGITGQHEDHMQDGSLRISDNGYEASWNFKTSGPKKFWARRK
jgi:hypothetical protein